MHASSFPCPHCAARLRIQDRKWIGRQVNCPDCHRPLRIVADGPKSFAAVAAEAILEERRPTVSPPVPATARPSRLAEWASQAGAAVFSPLGIGWLVAGSLTLTIALALGLGRDGAVIPSNAHAAPAAEPPEKAHDGKSAEAGKGNGKEVKAATAESRLRWLGHELDRFQSRHGAFPSGAVEQRVEGLPATERLSWFATIVSQSSEHGNLQPWWDQPWDSAANDRFVRRVIPELLDPGNPKRVGENRYPTTHFAGVAGVGADAPRLPADHARAGVFGLSRRTRLEHIRDGMANTMAVAAVHDGLGSWAAAGRATTRPFTREPYIGGPDGFGSAGSNELPVLMADGSVRTLSPQTDPRVIRGMAAMADGLPLELESPRQPPSQEPSQPAESPVPLPLADADENERAEQPSGQPSDRPAAAASAEAVIAQLLQDSPPPVETIDVAGKLRQPIARFEQTQAVPAQELLIVLEELCGVPIHYDAEELAAQGVDLQQPLALALEKTTAGEILQALLQRLGAHFAVESDGVRVRAGSSAPEKPANSEP